jgi:hypothetical protein
MVKQQTALCGNLETVQIGLGSETKCSSGCSLGAKLPESCNRFHGEFV